MKMCAYRMDIFTAIQLICCKKTSAFTFACCTPSSQCSCYVNISPAAMFAINLCRPFQNSLCYVLTRWVIVFSIFANHLTKNNSEKKNRNFSQVFRNAGVWFSGVRRSRWREVTWSSRSCEIFLCNFYVEKTCLFRNFPREKVLKKLA